MTFGDAQSDIVISLALPAEDEQAVILLLSLQSLPEQPLEIVCLYSIEHRRRTAISH